MKKLLILLILLIFIIAPVFLHAAEVIFLGADSFVRKQTDSYVIIETHKVFIQWTSPNLTYNFQAPVKLPEGAKIYSMVVFFRDKNANAEMWAQLIRENRYEGTQQTIIPTWTSTDGSESYRKYKLTNVNYTYNKVLNNACTYHVKIDFYQSVNPSPTWADLELYGVKIFYSSPTF